MMIDSLAEDVKQSLRDWHGIDSSHSALSYLHLYKTLQRTHYDNARRSTNRLLLLALDTLQEQYPVDATLLRKRFLDSLPVTQIAHELNIAESTFYSQQRTALARIVEVVEQMERDASAGHQSAQLLRLEPPSYVNLIGVDENISALTEVIHNPAPPWIISIEGMGGLGKTSLADSLMRAVVEQGLYDEIGWVSARQTMLDLEGTLTDVKQPALTAQALVDQLFHQLHPDLAGSIQTPRRMHEILHERLKQTPHLIVIDNLETVVDVESLLPTLQTMANPTRFIITSRHRLYAVPNIFHFLIPMLGRENALALIRQEADLSNLQLLAESTDEALAPIYETVGGNPLAIRLVVGQAHVHPLSTITNNLLNAKSESAENLYNYIYRQAWESLDELSQQVLLSMPLTPPSGDSAEFIAKLRQIETDTLLMALNNLVVRNLVDARGGLEERRYSIHGLTRSFLHQQVIQWI